MTSLTVIAVAPLVSGHCRLNAVDMFAASAPRRFSADAALYW